MGVLVTTSILGNVGQEVSGSPKTQWLCSTLNYRSHKAKHIDSCTVCQCLNRNNSSHIN